MINGVMRSILGSRGEHSDKPKEPKSLSLCACCSTESPTTLHQVPVNSESIDVALCARCVSIGAHRFANHVALCTLMFVTDGQTPSQKHRGLTADELDKGWP